MSKVQEIKQAATALSAAERVELARWLAGTTETEIQAEKQNRQEWLRRWRELIARTNAAVGPLTWKREELYER